MRVSAEQGPQAPLGHALVGPSRPPGPRGPRGGGGGGGAAGPRGSWRQDTGRTPPNGSRGIRGRRRTAVGSVARMSSRTCAKPACNVSASATLTYDYASQHGVARALNAEAHPMRYDLCTDHADALAGPAGLGPAGPARALPAARRSPPDFRRLGARVPCPGDRGRHRARRRGPAEPSAGASATSPSGWVVVQVVVAIVVGIGARAPPATPATSSTTCPLRVVRAGAARALARASSGCRRRSPA